MTRYMTRRSFLLPLLLAELLVACTRPDGTSGKRTGDAAQPVPGDWAIVRFENEPDTLNPLTSVTTVASYALWGAKNSQVYELLMGYNTRDWDVTEPLLAEAAPTVSDDHVTYTVKIREGVKWHDGQPFTPEDVLFTFKAAACPLTDAARHRSSLTDLAEIQVGRRALEQRGAARADQSGAHLREYVGLRPHGPQARLDEHEYEPPGLLWAHAGDRRRGRILLAG